MLIEYSKDFGYLAPPQVDENPNEYYAQPNPKLWSKIFGKKMFYTDVAGMRQKQTRLEAEEDKSDNESIAGDEATDTPDVTYQIQGFPRDSDEMECALQNQTSYQLALYIRPADRLIEIQSKEEGKPAPDDLSKEYIDLTKEIRKTHRNSPWRNCITRVYIFKENRESTEEALNGIVETIMHTSERYLEYTKWLKSTTVTPLCPLQPPEPGFQESGAPDVQSSQSSLPSAASKPNQQRSQKQFSVPASTHKTSQRQDDTASHF